MKFPKFEQLLVQSLWTIFDENTCVPDELIREKSKRIIIILNQNNSENHKINMNLSNARLLNSKNETLQGMSNI